MAESSLHSVARHFDSVIDPRVERTREHDLLDIISLTLCAIIGGANTFVAVSTFGEAKIEWFRTFLRLPNGIPSHDTIGRVFRLIDPQQFQDAFCSWMAAVAQRLGLKQIAIDGKTLKGSHERGHGKNALHMVSAWATENHLSLGQVAVDAKSNEITAIPELLKMLDISGALVTIDAMGCQTEIAKTIREGDGDYLLAVKENQLHLYEDIERLAKAALDRDYEGIDIHITKERGHSRDELRMCYVMDCLDTVRDHERWPDLKSLIVVVRERMVNGKSSSEVSYHISNRIGSAKMFAGAIRQHWGIENSLHWVLDVSFEEDASRIRKDHAPENMALLRRLAVSMLKNAKIKGSMNTRRLFAGWNEDTLEQIIRDFMEI